MRLKKIDWFATVGKWMMTDQPSDETRRGLHASDFLSGVRQIFDLVLSLLIAVLLVRTFLLQGYLISTGSMAPHYYGQQKRVVCPQCRFPFAVGTEFDSKTDIQPTNLAICPNCLAAQTDLSSRPINRGDHLLVWKNAYQFRDPQRWEVVVFRNPNDPLETYIKRVAGLPGERISIRDGNIWIDEKVIGKTLEQQRALRIPIDDGRYLPTPDETWVPRWSSEMEDTGWSQTGTIWRFVPTKKEQEDWLTFRQTVRFGGEHETTVCLPEEFSATISTEFTPEKTTFPFTPEPPFPGVRWDRGCLITTGALSPSTHQKLGALSSSPLYQELLKTLFNESRRIPVSDFLAYNHELPASHSVMVDECFLEAKFRPEQLSGSINVEMQTSSGLFLSRFQLEEGQVSLLRGEDLKLVQEVRLEPSLNEFVVEMSSFDEEIVVAVNGKEIIREPRKRDIQRQYSKDLVSLVRISGTTTFQIDSLKLFRDVYYTNPPDSHGSGDPLKIPSNHYFVLGDNSRVSSDSRLWETPIVPRKLLVGKPFLVHLPSTQETIGWGEWRLLYRWPDFSRIRFVR